jgi:putative tryptophan/tyrosine transport system substrate-binding protein
MPVISFLGSSSGLSPPSAAGFREGLSETGYVEGQNVAIEYRWAEGHYDRLPALAVDLVSRKVEVIATSGGASSALAAKTATSTIPIIFVAADPVGAGLVTNLARPGGNLTGFSILSSELTPKRLELLSEMVPQASVIALLVNPDSPSAERLISDTQRAALAKGVQLCILKARAEGGIETAFTALVELHAGGLVVAADPFLESRREQIARLAARHVLPAIYVERQGVEVGGLISYGVSFADVFRETGIYVGRILKGAAPADLPVQEPTTFELVINLKTAKTLGLTVPPSLLARADEVIQ